MCSGTGCLSGLLQPRVTGRVEGQRRAKRGDRRRGGKWRGRGSDSRGRRRRVARRARDAHAAPDAARAVRTDREMQTFRNDALHVAGKKKTRLRRRNASRVVASRGWVGGRRRAVVGPPARGGKRGGDVPGRNTCAISRHLSSARSNGRNDLPRPRIWTRRLCFVFAPKSANSSERKPACSTFQIVWYDESMSYEPCRTAYSKREARLRRIFSRPRIRTCVARSGLRIFFSSCLVT